MRLTVSEIEKKYNIGPTTIRKWVKKGFLSIQDNYKKGQPFLVDEQELLQVKKLYWSDAVHRSYEVGWNRTVFHKIDTPEKAYWLGFILADGCIHITDSDKFLGHFSIDIGGEDKEHLYKFTSFVESTPDIVQFTTHSITGNQLAHVQLCCAETLKDLYNLGIHPRKSGEEQWIETPYPADFIRGCYDGDGYIKKDLYSIGLVGSYGLLNAIQQHFLSVLDIKPKIIGEHGTIFRIEYAAKEDKKKIANYLWYDGCVSLTRKKELAEKIKKIC